MKKHFLSAFFVMLLSFTLPAQTVVYVSASGQDDASGSKQNPVGTLQKAIDIVKRSAAKSAEIRVLGGVYRLDTTVVIEKVKNLVIRKEGAQPVLFSGGLRVDNWRAVSKNDLLYKRFKKSIVHHLRVADLKALGITDYGKFRPRGFGLKMTALPMELYYNDQPMTIARWPDSGWVTIKKVEQKRKRDGFVYGDRRPEKWPSVKDVWMHGYWKWDWADSYVEIDSLDKRGNFIFSSTEKKYPFTKGARYYYLNIPEELDRPGEYYIDRKNGMLYFYPPNDKQRSTDVSLLETPMIRLIESENVVVQGLQFKYSRGIGIEIVGGKHNRVSDCVLGNLGILAVSVGAFEPNLSSKIYGNTLYNGKAGNNNGITNCVIYNTGEGGVILGGGDRKTLSPGHNFVENCRMFRCSRWSRTYRAGVFMYGVGNHVAHNEIYDLPHTAVFFWGNDHLIEYNNIHHVCMETADAGALYAGRDWTQRGTMLRYNYIHQLHGANSKSSFNAVMGIYFDDFCSGDTVYGNIFYKAGINVMIGGGRDHLVKNNIFIEGNPAVHVDGRGIGWAKYYFTDKEKVLFQRYEAVQADRPPYSEKYPALLSVLDDDPQLPKNNCIEDNVFCGGKWRDLLDGLTDKDVCFKQNVILEDCRFYRQEGTKIQIDWTKINLPEDFKKIPFEEIGLK